MMKTVKERLETLRKDMKKNGQNYIFFTTADPHMSEYVGECFKEREYFSGFTGSNGNLLVGDTDAYLWTDGRYFVQAEKELAGSGITLMKMGSSGVPTLFEFLEKTLERGDVLATDGRRISVTNGLKFEEVCKKNGAIFDFSYALPASLWTKRPMQEFGNVWTLDEKYSGESTENKIAKVFSEMEKKKATDFFLSKLDDIMWLFNLRGCDIKCNPVAYSYAHFSDGKILLFLKNGAFTTEISDYFQRIGIETRDYETIDDYLKKQAEHTNEKRRILLDFSANGYSVYQAFSKLGEVESFENMTGLWKAVKNETEQNNLKNIYLKDSVALTKFICFIKQNYEKERITETSAAKKIDLLRQGIPEFIDLSFPTISAYGENAAMMHYEADENEDVSLERGGIYLVDSGGQYHGGTTDVTRSLILGEVSPEMKKHFTLVCIGMLRLQNARFMSGCTGRNLDILARAPLWNEAMDYKCGTGHGIGYMLNVHEGPQNISWQKRENVAEAPLVPGMLVSDEPGVYVAGSHGIRTENILLCEKYAENEDGEFLCFHPLTLVPIDLDGILPEYMSEEDRKNLNEYHSMVYEAVSPYLNEEEKNWLKNVTKAV